MTVSDWLKNCHVSMATRHVNGFGAHRSNFTSVNEHATLDCIPVNPRSTKIWRRLQRASEGRGIKARFEASVGGGEGGGLVDL